MISENNIKNTLAVNIFYSSNIRSNDVQRRSTTTCYEI